MQASWEFLDAITSDLCFVARADTLEGLFAAAADALVSLTVADPESVREIEERFALLRTLAPENEPTTASLTRAEPRREEAKPTVIGAAGLD